MPTAKDGVPIEIHEIRRQPSYRAMLTGILSGSESTSSESISDSCSSSSSTKKCVRFSDELCEVREVEPVKYRVSNKPKAEVSKNKSTKEILDVIFDSDDEQPFGGPYFHDATLDAANQTRDVIHAEVPAAPNHGFTPCDFNFDIPRPVTVWEWCPERVMLNTTSTAPTIPIRQGASKEEVREKMIDHLHKITIQLAQMRSQVQYAMNVIKEL